MMRMFGRRETAAGVLGCGLIGLAVFAWHESRPHSGATSAPALILLGIVIWLLPLAWTADRAVRTAGPAGIGYIVISAATATLLATRPTGHFAAVWLVFVAAVSLVGVAALRIGVDEMRRRRPSPAGTAET